MKNANRAFGFAEPGAMQPNLDVDVRELRLYHRLEFRIVGKSALGVIQQIENIRAYLGRIGVPAFFPVAVKLPRDTRATVFMLSAPRAESYIRVGEARVGAKVDRGRDTACGQLRALNSIVAGEGLRYFGAHFD